MVDKPPNRAGSLSPSPLPGAFLDWTRKLEGGLACRGVLKGSAIGKLQDYGFGGPGTGTALVGLAGGLGSALEPEAALRLISFQQECVLMQ